MKKNFGRKGSRLRFKHNNIYEQIKYEKVAITTCSVFLLENEGSGQYGLMIKKTFATFTITFNCTERSKRTYYYHS